MLALLVGAAVGGLTYATARQRRASTGSSVAAAAATGAGSAIAVSVVASLWPLALAAGVGYMIARRSKGPKALGPGSGG
ncbi:MAG: hypothetical protein H6711_32910 [Myxococcales bacterium]|nr:hypothetical protein [Myxococcales bacterium]